MNLITRPHSLQKKVSLRPSFKKKNYKTLFQGSTPLEQQRRCVKMRTFFFYAQSPDFHKQGLCYYLKILYL